ncbi:Phosphoenolpyruvate/pyruvate domain-containing protein [Echria macrotheca]|uniref:Phosphoenolpyruvate/pyruvate domain-containing protein n=1 Tax=Echria macrotheca TaxID=438768 RepID=A0AAJ0B5B7_9PEZI|nr:Phosphoenolpyruvate/pyruvate domain-containing protein [Echria macrotheca]
MNTAASTLRAQLASDELIICPGVQDGLSARVCLAEGFKTLYMTGAGTSAVHLGQPDLSLLTPDDMVRTATLLTSVCPPTVPVIADCDTGYGGPLMVRRTVQRYIRAGVAGLHIEDQMLDSKRCGHLMHKILAPVDVFVARIRAAVAARKELGSELVIIARTDALQSEGFEGAVKRLRAAVEAGADVVFLEGMTSLEEMGRVTEVMAPTPCLLNMVGGGVTPLVDGETARRLGFKVVIWPCFAMTAALVAYRAAAAELKGTGMLRDTVDGETGRVVGGIRDVFEVCGLEEAVAFDREVGGAAFAEGA